MRSLLGCAAVILVGLTACKKESSSSGSTVPGPAVEPTKAQGASPTTVVAPTVTPEKGQPGAKKANLNEAVTELWTWVGAHLDELGQIQTGKEPVAEELARKLDAVDPGLTYELGLGKKPMEIIISADGKKELFELVKQVVASAPPLEGAKVVAFRPRKDPSLKLSVGDTTVSGSDVSFTLAEDEARQGQIAVRLYMKSLTRENEESMRGATFLLLEAAVGEYDLETRLGGISVDPFPEKPRPGMKPLKDLPAALDRFGR